MFILHILLKIREEKNIHKKNSKKKYSKFFPIFFSSCHLKRIEKNTNFAYCAYTKIQISSIQILICEDPSAKLSSQSRRFKTSKNS